MKALMIWNTRNEGLTLIELVIAMFIMTIGVVSIMAVLVSGEKANRASQAKAIALNAAQERLEAIFADSPDNVVTYAGTFPVPDLIGPGGGDAGNVIVSGNEPHEVTVTVTWEGTGILASGSVTLSALRSTAPR